MTQVPHTPDNLGGGGRWHISGAYFSTDNLHNNICDEIVRASDLKSSHKLVLFSVVPSGTAWPSF